MKTTSIIAALSAMLSLAAAAQPERRAAEPEPQLDGVVGNLLGNTVGGVAGGLTGGLVSGAVGGLAGGLLGGRPVYGYGFGAYWCRH